MAILTSASRAALARLRAFRAPPSRYPDLPLTRRAAVLVLLYADRRGDLRVVLTIRSATLRNYAGQAALPGGKADSLSETAFQTARREAYEEIGLPFADDEQFARSGYSVEHLTELPCNLAVTELGVRPCVAYLRSSKDDGIPSKAAEPSNDTSADVGRDLLPRLDVKEVAALFTAPFHNFLRAEDEYERDRSVPGRWYDGGSWHSWHEEAWRMHQFYVPVTRGRSVRGKQAEDNETTTTESTTTAATRDDRLPTQPGASKQSRDINVPLHKRQGQLIGPRPENSLGQDRYRVFGLTARILVDCARVAYAEAPTFEHNSSFGDEDMIGRLQRMGRMGPVREKGDVLTRDIMTKASKL